MQSICLVRASQPKYIRSPNESIARKIAINENRAKVLVSPPLGPRLWLNSLHHGTKRHERDLGVLMGMGGR